jgi:hypothetical protein
MRSISVAFVLATFVSATAWAQPVAGTIEFKFTPTARTQLALWIEKADGTFLKTVRLTQAVSLRGIGNRPGASQMNSGFRWPYGRREGVLPIWAHRRAAAPNAKQFKRVIFQDRRLPDGTPGEGLASRTSNDSSLEYYFCLSFTQMTTQKEALDAVSCASPFNSDKGRFMTTGDSAYAEPVEKDGVGTMRVLDLVSLYPPRRDVQPCASCVDRPEVATYAAHARDVMPDIDAVTMATPPADVEQSILFTVPSDWANGDYVAWIEVNVEGDYNDHYNPETYPTPNEPSAQWDVWALTYGYPYRGQPSVVYQVPFSLGPSGVTKVTSPSFYGDPDGFGPAGGVMHPMDGNITDAPTVATARGSGADRLQLVGTADYRFQVTVRGPELCEAHAPPAAPTMVRANPVANTKHSHEWGTLHFVVPASETPILHYEVKLNTSADPITVASPESFARAFPAYAPKIDTEMLMVPVGQAAGSAVDVDFGGMDPETSYTVAIRAIDMCNVPGPYAVADLTTTRRNFTKLSGCFIATAAYGSAMEPEVQSLREVRDALRPRSAVLAAATDLYYRSGPAAAAAIARSDSARAVVRSLLGPVVEVASAVAPFLGRGSQAPASASVAATK